MEVYARRFHEFLKTGNLAYYADIFNYLLIARSMKVFRLLLFLPLVSVLTGCGQPGPLYLPIKPSPAQVEPAPKAQPKVEPRKTQ